MLFRSTQFKFKSPIFHFTQIRHWSTLSYIRRNRLIHQHTIIACQNATGIKEDKAKQYNAEAHFLRAYYVHLLLKLYGNIPYFEAPLEDPYVARQYTADEIYAEIMADLEVACEDGILAMTTNAKDDGAVTDRGRVCRAAALMLKARVVMYHPATWQQNHPLNQTYHF